MLNDHLDKKRWVNCYVKNQIDNVKPDDTANCYDTQHELNLKYKQEVCSLVLSSLNLRYFLYTTLLYNL